MINDKKNSLPGKKIQISLLYEKFVNAKPEIIVDFSGIETERQNIEFKLQLKTNLNFIDTPTLDVVILNSISQPKTWIELSKEDYKIDKAFPSEIKSSVFQVLLINYSNKSLMLH